MVAGRQTEITNVSNVACSRFLVSNDEDDNEEGTVR